MDVTLIAMLLHFIVANVAANGAINSVSVPISVEEVVAESSFDTQAGKVDDPVAVPGIGMEECRKQAPAAIASWMNGHPIYRAWMLRGWKCAPGHYDIPRRA